MMERTLAIPIHKALQCSVIALSAKYHVYLYKKTTTCCSLVHVPETCKMLLHSLLVDLVFLAILFQTLIEDYSNNSYIYYDVIQEGRNALKCVTNAWSKIAAMM